MKLIRVGAAVLNQTPLDWRSNRRNISQAIAEARSRGVSLLALPELCIPGYGCDDAYQSPSVQRTSLDHLVEIAEETTGMVVVVGLPVQYRKALFNCAAVLADGEILGFAAKRYLAGEGLYYEPRWFKAWPERKVGEIEVDGRPVPLGDVFFVCDGVSIGLEICEEAWTFRRPGAGLAARGVDVVLNPSASHFAFGKQEVRRRFVLEGSRAFGVSYVFTNLLGNAAGRMIFDGGAMIASGGRMLAEGPRFSFADYQLTQAVIDVEQTRMQQVRSGSFHPDLELKPEERVVAKSFRFPEMEPEEWHEQRENPWIPGDDDKEEEFTRATSLALVDYLRKSRSRGFVVSLSGGADSAATTLLVATAFRLLAQELGLDGLRRRLDYLELDEEDDVEAVIRRLLLCVYQGTRHSSEETLEAARAVAEGSSAEFLVLDVDPLVQGYSQMVEKAIGRELTWERDDVALQNIQARVRAPGIWMLANLRDSLLLATSNRSEAAVGYTTMDGDTAGGLSPIAGIDKAFLRRWLRWMEEEGPTGLGPVPQLAKVNRLEPTAELRPEDADQTDEDDLMPYDLLDAIEKAAIGEKKAPIEVYRTMRASFPDLDHQRLARWIERFFRLWCRNQWKRERFAPSFHVDDKNLDPKTWCRFPILSGGYEVELEELRKLVEAEAES